jgi:phenylpropionate dioxygenase-like ring-hydroxylating dioxygenase large terminal subunit
MVHSDLTRVGDADSVATEAAVASRDLGRSRLMYPLADGMFAPRNQWYVAAWSSDITREPIERWILNEPVAFYRKQDGTPVALDGRCPHRSFPLGKSRVVGDDVECGYHGITFRPDGSCARIPTQENIPNGCRVRSYPLVEKWKWIWIWPGDPALADEALLPDHFEIGLTDPRYKCAGNVYNHVPCRYMLLHDNLFDLTHIGYLHRDTFGGGGGGSDEAPIHSHGPGWVASHFDQPDIECPPFFAEMLGHSGKINRRFGLKLLLPCLHVGGEEFHTGPNNENFVGALRIYHSVTPATRTSCHYFFAAGHSWDHPDPMFAEGIVANIVPAIQEDVTATSYVEELVAHHDRPSELPLHADHVGLRGRRMFEDMIIRENDGLSR